MDLLNKLKNLFGLGDPQETKAIAEDVNAKAKQPLLPSAPLRREEIVAFIVQSLQPYVDEKDTSIKGLQLYVLCPTAEDEQLTRVALYADQDGKFRQQELVRKLENNFIQLPPNWIFDYRIVRDLMPDCRFRTGNFGLDIINQLQKGRLPSAKITALDGQLSGDEYILDPNETMKFFIGRGQHPRLESGRSHTNQIFFLEPGDPGYDETKAGSNRFVSRNHAYIVFNPQENKFFLFVDKGGLSSSGNKTKIYKSGDTLKVERLDIPGAAFELTDGDQIELGGEAKLLFTANRS